jgi:hemolysin III
MTLSDLLPKLHYPTRAEKLVDGWLHGVALMLFTFAVGAALGLAIWQGGLGMASAVAVYAVCVMAMIGCSMAYNLTEEPKRKALLRRFDHAAIFWLAFYIALGWMVCAALEPMLDGVPLAGLILLAIGGALYTLGVPFYVWEKLPFRRAIWHAFVMAAAGVHYAAVLTGVVFA